MTDEQQRLYTATNRLARFYGLYTARDLAGRIALDQLQGIAGATESDSFDLPPPPQEVVEIIASLIDTSEGAYLFKDLVSRINNLMEESGTVSDTGGGDGTITQRVNNLLQVVGPAGHTLEGSDADTTLMMTDEDSHQNVFVDINDIIPNNDFINSNPNNPDKETSPHLSVIKVNNVRITPAARNINANVIFLNGIPNIELARAVPFFDCKLILPGAPISQNGRLQNLSLFRFLEGNVQVDAESNSNRSTIALASRTRNDSFLEGEEANEQNTTFTETGMEIFTSPQLLVNGNESSLNSNRVNPVLDKFQPLMSMKDFVVEVAPSTGLMSFKTAKLSFVLHDRSRLAEIANLIRPDLYARTELMIEYGWTHPEANVSGPTITNYYAELINAMRSREKYGIINSSLAFDDAGQVNITLELAMRGGSDFSSETISIDQNGAVNQILRTIRELSETVGMYRRRIFGDEAGPSSVEVRGVQFLDAAEDARNNLILDANMTRQLRDLQRTLSARGSGATGSEAARQLANTLTSLYGTASGASSSSSSSGSGGRVEEVRRTVQASIRNKMISVGTGPDPFLRPDALSSNTYITSESGALVGTRRNSRGRSDTARETALNNELRDVAQDVSLAKLLLIFVGEPLAMTRKFDDIQFIFYPMNDGAGFARNLNVGSFIVDTRYFYENYTRLRLESLSRSANMNLTDFLQFIGATIVDDHAARSYGLFGSNGALFRRVSTDGGLGSTDEAIGDAVELQNRIERLLSGVTPDASFRMPQIDFYLECLPQRVLREGDGTDVSPFKTILRIHVFDRHSTSFETQGALIASARDEEIRNIGNIPEISGGDPGINASYAREGRSILEAASNAGLIELISPESGMYRPLFNTVTLKEFLKRTMPYIIYGTTGTTIKRASLTSIQDAALSTVNMLRSFQNTENNPAGESPGGLPLQIIPCELSLSAYGCPLIDFAQQFFIDFQTGTSVDNIYGVVGITHKISQGDFSTDMRLAPLDAYGVYRSLIGRLNNAAEALRAASDNNSTATSAAISGP